MNFLFFFLEISFGFNFSLFKSFPLLKGRQTPIEQQNSILTRKFISRKPSFSQLGFDSSKSASIIIYSRSFKASIFSLKFKN